ncbi:unnamed protein product [Leuciscus chuanchicus]
MDKNWALKQGISLLDLQDLTPVFALDGRVLAQVSCSTAPEEPGDLSGVPEEYFDLRAVFSRSRAASLPPHRPYDCSIELLPGTTPPRGRLYSLSVPERKALEKYLSDSLDAAFEILQGAQFFTKLDLRNAYHLLRIKEGDEWKTAFNTPLGHFEYRVLPFGLVNAVFQALVNDVLRDMLNLFVFVYLDDILIFSPNLQVHVQHVRQVLQRLLENRLFVKAEKCTFHSQSVTFLGSVISTQGISMDPAKVRALTDWPRPESRVALQRFLGFANFYRRFIQNFCPIAAPLTALTSVKIRFFWTEAAEAAFELLKSRFSSAPILVSPDLEKQFIVEVDASEVGVGAILSQRASADERIHPCAFFSHRLTPTEQNYDAGNRELLAIRLALGEWRHWLEGAAVPFVGNHVILTVIDRFSKAAHFIPLPKLPSARETAQIVVDHVFKIHGLPENVVSDRGPQFSSLFWKEFCRLIGASVSLSSGFHAQTNGQAERANQTIGRLLRTLAFRNPASWPEQLPWAEYAYNSAPASATGLSPFQGSLGYQPPLFSASDTESKVPSVKAFIQRCKRTWRMVRSALCKSRSVTRRSANKRCIKSPRYVRGQKVWLSTANLPLQYPSRKLAPKFIGPFRVIKVLSPVSVRLRLPANLRRVHPVFHVSCLKPVIRAPPCPVLSPVRVEGSPVYRVRRLLDVRPRGRGHQFLVDWEGYGPEERCWIPSRDVLDRSLIDDFFRSLSGQCPATLTVVPSRRGCTSDRDCSGGHKCCKFPCGPACVPPVFRKPAAEPPKPPGKPAAKPPGKPAAEPPGKPAAEPPGKPVAKPPGKPAAEPPGKPPGKPAAKPRKPSAELPEPSTEEPEPSAELSEPSTEPPEPEPSDELPVKPAAKPPKPPMKPAAEPPKPPGKPAAEPPGKPPGKPAAEPRKPPVKPSAKLPEPSNELPEPSAELPEPSTEPPEPEPSDELPVKPAAKPPKPPGKPAAEPPKPPGKPSAKPPGKPAAEPPKPPGKPAAGPPKPPGKLSAELPEPSNELPEPSTELPEPSTEPLEPEPSDELPVEPPKPAAKPPKPPMKPGAEPPKPPMKPGAEPLKSPMKSAAEPPKPPVKPAAQPPKPPMKPAAKPPKPTYPYGQCPGHK